MCEHRWQPKRRWWSCDECGLAAVSMAAISVIDPDGFVETVDPTGVQRDFAAACGLELQTFSTGADCTSTLNVNVGGTWTTRSP